ncbi:response regulator [Paraglaciecola sp.]|uniref:response regulator n=1 Tax=Paraglaciecola sp. TaxID=1920173 RepID=UPI003EF090F8
MPIVGLLKKHLSKLIILTFLALPICYGQADSAVSEKQQVIQRLDGLKKIIQQDMPTADKELQQIQSIIKQNQYDDLTSQLLNLQSYANILKQDYQQAFKNLLEARKSATRIDNQLEIAKSLRFEGLILDFVGEHAKAIASLNESLAIFNSINPKQSLRIYGSLANVYISLNQYEQVLMTGKKLYSLAQQFDSDTDKAVAQWIIGDALIELEQLSESKYHIALSEELAKKSEYPFIGNFYSSKTKLHLKEGNLEAALNSIIQSAESDKKVGFLFGEGLRTLQLAEVYQGQGTPELAIAELTNKLDTPPIQNDKQQVLKLLDKLSELHQAKGDFKHAYEYASQYRQVYQQSYNERQSQQLALNQAKMDVQEKDQQISQLTKEQELNAQLNLNQQYVIALLLIILLMLTMLIYRNIKHKQRLQAYSEEVQAANHAKSDFLARMSHEIRTPINAISGLTKLMQKNAEHIEDMTNLRQIDEASDTLMGVINDILDFSKIEAGKLDIETTNFQLDKIIGTAIRLQSIKATQKNIELIQHIARDVPLYLKGDGLRIQQVLVNLLSNAVKFTDDGLVSVRVQNKQTDKGVLLEFSVKDTGIGLSQNQIEGLFQSFAQVDESISRKYGGTGLGLAICKELVELMGGKIWVESQPQIGSTFFFTLPLEEEKNQHINSPSKLLSGLNVLVADDVSLSRQVIAETLRQANISTELAEGGQQTLNKLRLAQTKQKPYDLLILDWKMPDIDGLQVAAIINQEFSANKPKIIMLSAFDFSHMRQQAKDLGIKSFIEKPFSASELINTIQETTFNIKPSTSLQFTEMQNVPDLSAKRILLAEDNTLNQKVALGFLKYTKAEVILVENGLEVIEAYKHQEAFDCILMDIQMPEMDGLTATSTLRNEFGCTLPIIAMTANAMKQDIQKSTDVGMTAHITKPIDPAYLYQVLAEVLLASSPVLTQKSVPNIEEKTIPSIETLLIMDHKNAMQKLFVDQESFASILDDFLEKEPVINTLSTFIEEHDYPGIYKVIHDMHPALAYIGAYNLAKLAKTLEGALFNKTQENDPTLNAQLTLFNQAMIALINELKSQK